MSGKVYFSKKSIEDCIWNPDYLTFLFIPNKWWSIKQWKLAMDLRKNFELIGIVDDKK